LVAPKTRREEGLLMTEWISVRDHLPDYGEQIIVKMPPLWMEPVHDFSRIPSLAGVIATSDPQPEEVEMLYEFNSAWNEGWFYTTFT
jgi:hypothetical protein